MNTKSATTPYTIRLNNETRAALETEAAHEDRSVAQVATRAIESMLAAKAAKRKAIEAALTEADRGSFISDTAMSAWVDSWGSNDEKTPPAPDNRQ